MQLIKISNLNFIFNGHQDQERCVRVVAKKRSVESLKKILVEVNLLRLIDSFNVLSIGVVEHLLHSRQHGLIDIRVCGNDNFIVDNSAASIFHHDTIRLLNYHASVFNRLINN